MPTYLCKSPQENCASPRIITLNKDLEKLIGIRVPLICYTYLLSVYVAEMLGIYDQQRYIFYLCGTHKNIVSQFCSKMITTLMTLPIMKKVESHLVCRAQQILCLVNTKPYFYEKMSPLSQYRKPSVEARIWENEMILIEMHAFRVVCYGLKVDSSMEAWGNYPSAI